MKKNNYQYSSLAGIKFIDEDGKEMDAVDAMHQIEPNEEELGKASFNGNRSAAGAYAARVRWGTNQPASGSSHGLNTDLPVSVGQDGNLLVEYEPQRFRAPTAVERRAPTSAEFSESIDSDLQEFRQLHLSRKPTNDSYLRFPEKDKAVEDQIASAKRNITNFHRVYDGSGTGWSDKAAASVSTLTLNVLRLRTTGAHERSPEKAVLERIISKIESVQESFRSLRNPPKP